MKTFQYLTLLGASLVFGHTAMAGDVVKGKKLFGQCAACHAVGPGAANKFGPSLNGIFERNAASVDGYDYSQNLSSFATETPVWTHETMDAFLEAPMKYIQGTKMAFMGVGDAQDRQDMIAYLASIREDGSTDASLIPEPKVAVVKEPEEPRPLARDTVVPSHGVLHLGRPALEEEVMAWDIDVRPDGQGLPEGSGDAIAGGEIYDAQCASCHGVFGEGEGRWPILAGGFDTLTEDRPEKTIGSYWPYLSTVFDYVKRAMPFGNVRSLSDDEVYSLTAYILYLNDLADEDFELSSENFASIEMPNVANFIPDNRTEESSYRLDAGEEPCMADCMEEEAVVTQRARVLDVTPDSDDSESSSAGID